MPSHEKHHFVPRFLLQEWHTGPDDKLSCFRWESSRFLHHRYTAKSVAAELRLYSIGLSQLDDGNILEREYFAEKIDSPAAVVHKLILSNGIDSLNQENRKTWARFLLAQVVRTPDKVEYVRDAGSRYLRDFLLQRVVDKVGLPQIHKSALDEFLKSNAPDFASNFSVAHLPSAIEAQLKRGELLNVHWLLRKIRPTTTPFLISDRPIVYEGKLEAGFVIAMPISPFVFFVASSAPNAEKLLNKFSDPIFSTRVNYSTASTAERYVYACGESQSKFVKRYLVNGN
jgi:Protein of unknown function (DUF4238)